MRIDLFTRLLLLTGCTFLLKSPVIGQTVLEGPGYPGFNGQVDNIVSEKITDRLYMMTTHDGNFAVFPGNDGILLVDDRYDVMGPSIIEEVRAISKAPIKFVINTHFHGDHTGANGYMSANGALLIAHDNVRKTLSQIHSIEAIKSRFAAYPPESLPTVTYSNRTAFYFNDEEILVFHVPNAHTDGDTIVYFKGSDVIASGDAFQRNGYPVFDRSNQGSFLGLLNSWKMILDVAGADTKIIQGHGPLATYADLQLAYKNMSTVKERVATGIAEGKSREQIIAAKPTTGFDTKWPPKPMTPDLIAGWLYDELMARK